MLVDSHCHLSFPELHEQREQVFAQMREAGVHRALCVCTTLEEFDKVHSLTTEHPGLWASVGVHPDNEGVREPTLDDLLQRAALPRVVAIGETGLDYYDMEGRKGGRSVEDMQWQRDRFCVHIEAASQTGLPLIVHTRNASDDTLDILQRKVAATALTGVFHCFTETAQVARAALDMGFFISFSGIITFKSAQELRDVVSMVPMDSLLIETDSPYLAPVPFRGKTNTPAYVRHVAAQVAVIKGLSLEEVAEQTTANFERLFPKTLGHAQT